MPTFGKVLNLTKDRWVNYWGDVMNQLQYLIRAISGEELTSIVQQRGDLLKQLGCYSRCYRVDQSSSCIGEVSCEESLRRSTDSQPRQGSGL